MDDLTENHLEERIGLSTERIREIPEEQTVFEPFRRFFIRWASFLRETDFHPERRKNPDNSAPFFTTEEIEDFFDIYDGCFLFLQDLFREAFLTRKEESPDRKAERESVLELFLELYGIFSEDRRPVLKSVREACFYYCFDEMDLWMSVEKDHLAEILPGILPHMAWFLDGRLTDRFRNLWQQEGERTTT